MVRSELTEVVLYAHKKVKTNEKTRKIVKKEEKV